MPILFDILYKLAHCNFLLFLGGNTLILNLILATPFKKIGTGATKDQEIYRMFPKHLKQDNSQDNWVMVSQLGITGILKGSAGHKHGCCEVQLVNNCLGK